MLSVNTGIGHIIDNTVEPGPNLLKLDIKPGLASKTMVLNELDDAVVEYLRGQADKFHKSHSQVINNLVNEKLAVSV